MARPSRPEGEGLSRSYVRPCLLLLLAEGPSHGYELLEQVRQAGVRNADAGGLYRSLRSMEQSGLVSSWWEPSQAGPARRSYLLTEEGREVLRGSLDAVREVHRLLGDVLDRYDLLQGASAANPLVPR
ncbi:MAG: PadR family transcriptional regulator [Actinomycetota bacterium]|jgi:DNA-binding PadR family transcriptional regulator|nr:PadR family transcriptional regulator [Actinomycetota bacterium]